MRTRPNFLDSMKLPILLFLIIPFLHLCSSPSEHYKEEETQEIIEFPEPDNYSLKKKKKKIKIRDYKTILAVDEHINMNETAELRVWIGAQKAKAKFHKGMKKDSSLISSELGQYAKIIPYAPDFEISPSQVECIKIHPSGSDVRFSLKPIKTGTFKVSASIKIYEQKSCEGDYVPKTTTTLSVTVEVNTKKVIKNKLCEAGDIVWEKFLNFWSALWVLLFGVLIFLIRKKLKKKTGFKDGEIDTNK
ncbi:MAG: hypothetical protein MI739_09980 [Bacteroidales bacterium]|nr:hypothetical protein [Bacteroidales bacterium]